MLTINNPVRRHGSELNTVTITTGENTFYGIGYVVNIAISLIDNNVSCLKNVTFERRCNPDKSSQVLCWCCFDLKAVNLQCSYLLTHSAYLPLNSSTDRDSFLKQKH